MMRTLVGCLLSLHLAAYFYCVGAQTGTDAKNLRKQLFERNGYDKKVRPRINQTEAIEVNVSLTLLSINELSEVTETLKTTGFLSIIWYDDYLQWNESDFDGLFYYQWPQSDVWKPDVALKNSVMDYKELGAETLNVDVIFDGMIRWYPFQVFQSTCSVDISYFPFDTQICQLKFVAWSYTYIAVMLQSDGSGIYLSEYVANPEWDIVDTSWDTVIETSVSSVVFSIHVKRKPQYIVLSIIMPITMLALLNLFVFVLPCDSGEKASYSITVFLAFAVFLTIVSSTLPESSDSVAIFSIFLIILTVQSTVITLIALAMIRFNSFDDNVPVPKILQVLFCALSFKMLREKKNDVDDQQDKHDRCLEVITIDQMKETPGNPINDPEIVSTDKKAQEGHGSKGRINESSHQRYTWKQAVNQLDRIFFIFFLTVFIVAVSVCAALAAS